MDPILLQKQIRDNVQDVQNYILDLKHWEKEMKRKEEKLASDSLDSEGEAPVRSKVQKSSKNQIRGGEKKKMDEKGKNISSLDYGADKDHEMLDQEEEYKFSDKNQGKESKSVDMKRSRDEAYYEKEMGNKFVKQKKWKEALECYTRAIEKYSFDAVFYANRALCHLKLNNASAAEKDCTQSLELDAAYVKAYQRRATARIELKYYQEAKVDLLKALELEPNNTFIKSQLSNLEENLHGTEQIPENSEKIVEVKSSEKLRNSSANTQESRSKKHPVFPTENQRLVLPITKPPHLRSKKPLKRIEIKEITDSSGGEKYITSVFQTYEPVNALPQTDECKTAYEDASNEGKIPQTHFVLNEKQCVDKMSENSTEAEFFDDIPSPPSSSVQFITAWNAFKNKPEKRFQYLKQIPGHKLSTIFRESMESNILSEIITALEKDFIRHKVEVYPYLKGLSQIKRFGALTMFLSNKDKSDVENLLDFCKANNECTEDEAAVLRGKYEL